MSEQAWTAAKVHDVLLKHVFTIDKYVYIQEVRSARGFGPSAIADAIAVCLWPSRGHYPMGIEIKVSRSDWLSELKNVGKSDEIWQNCSTWEVAAPEGIVKTEELPKGWGLIVVTENSAKRVVKPKHKEDAIPLPGFIMSLIATMHKDNERYINATVDERVAKFHAAHFQEKNKIAEELRVTLNENAKNMQDKKLVDSFRYIMTESGLGVYDVQTNPQRVIRELKEIKSSGFYQRAKEDLIRELDDFARKALALKAIYEKPPEVIVEPEHQPGNGDQVRSDLPQ